MRRLAERTGSLPDSGFLETAPRLPDEQVSASIKRQYDSERRRKLRTATLSIRPIPLSLIETLVIGGTALLP